MTVMPDTNAITALRLGNERVLFIFDHADMVFLFRMRNSICDTG